jgi:glycosyltransferase involved in cell wall biosynthesis
VTVKKVMKKRSVCIITSVHPARDVRILWKQGRSLARAGFQVSLIAPNDVDEIIDGVRIKAVPTSAGRLGRLSKTVWRVWREAERIGADIYHFHDPELIPIALILGCKGRKVIYDIHEDLPRDILTKYYLAPWIRRPAAAAVDHLEKFCSRFFSALVPATPLIAELFRGINRRVVLVQNFPLVNELAPVESKPWRDRIPSIAYVGNMTEVRGVKEMVAAMSELPQSLAATLELAGEIRPAALRAQLAVLPGWNRVRELGVINRASVAQLLGRTQAGLVVFHDLPAHRDAYPTKMFEYMAAGIPVIASDFPLWRNIVTTAKCGLLVDPQKPREIAEAIQFVLTHPAEAEAMGQRGREAVVRDFNWGREEQKLVALYTELLEH